MSMGVFMPPPAPLLSGGGGVFEGEITIGDYIGFLYGWSDGTIFPAFGSLSGDAAPYFFVMFVWDFSGVFYPGGGGTAGTIFEEPGAILEFQGQTYNLVEENELYVFQFGPEALTWPTSGTYPFTLTLP